MAKLRVTWRKSAIGYEKSQKLTIKALGLKRLGHSVEHDDSQPVRGMLHKVRHLIEIEEVSENR
ncbi:MAG TPA: 50S ribosomal protein L30 [Dehalococcoidia bacterium]|nr:50S ribosomal protein L30 [Dehalococcoidia bacterium]